MHLHQSRASTPCPTLALIVASHSLGRHQASKGPSFCFQPAKTPHLSLPPPADFDKRSTGATFGTKHNSLPAFQLTSAPSPAPGSTFTPPGESIHLSPTPFDDRHDTLHDQRVLHCIIQPFLSLFLFLSCCLVMRTGAFVLFL